MRDMVATGATKRQVDYWTRSGYLVADEVEPGAGHRRRWEDEEVGVCRLLVRLTNAGLAPDVAVAVARGDYEIGPGLFIFINPDDSQRGVQRGDENGQDPEQQPGGDPAQDVAAGRPGERAHGGRGERGGSQQ